MKSYAYTHRCTLYFFAYDCNIYFHIILYKQYGFLKGLIDATKIKQNLSPLIRFSVVIKEAMLKAYSLKYVKCLCSFMCKIKICTAQFSMLYIFISFKFDLIYYIIFYIQRVKISLIHIFINICI